MALAEGISVEVAYSPRAGVVDRVMLSLPHGATVADALAASGVNERHPEAASLPVGVWGRVQPADARLRDGDRVEVYRPLVVDPKEARRLRYKRQKAR
jgi:putative ubiquitin-RnfH superfamily antitoxin RatB of RatAB toxin-antitoxin module